MLKGKVYQSPVAKSVPYDNAASGLTSTDTQGAIDEIKFNAAISSSPGFSFGRSGVTNSGTYLMCETVPSNVSGRWVYVTSGIVENVYVSNENSTTYTIEVLYHTGNGIGLTSLGTVTVVSARGNKFTVNWPVPVDTQIAVRIATTSANAAKNIVCGLEIRGLS